MEPGQTYDLSAATEEPQLERRAEARVSLLRPVQFLHGDRLSIGELQDISASGMRLRTTQRIAEGTVLKLYVSLPQSSRDPAAVCVLEGRVIWYRADMVGLSFTDGALSSRRRVSELVRRELTARQLQP